MMEDKITMNEQQYVDIQKNEEWQKATADGKKAVAMFVKTLKKRLKIEAKLQKKEDSISALIDPEWRASVAAFYFFKWIAQCQGFEMSCSEKHTVPIILFWKNIQGKVLSINNIMVKNNDPLLCAQALNQVWGNVLINAGFDLMRKETDLIKQKVELLEMQLKEKKGKKSG